MRVEPVQRVEFDPWERSTHAPAYPLPIDAVPFREALATAVLSEEAKSLNLSEDDTEYFVFAGKEWAREHLGLFEAH